MHIIACWIALFYCLNLSLSRLNTEHRVRWRPVATGEEQRSSGPGPAIIHLECRFCPEMLGADPAICPG